MRHDNLFSGIRRGHAAPSLAQVALLSLLAYFSFITAAHAGTMASVLCWIVQTILWGDVGKASATIGVLAVAASAVMGRASWSMAVTVAVGISIIFGAGYIVGFFGLTACP